MFKGTKENSLLYGSRKRGCLKCNFINLLQLSGSLDLEV